MLDGQPTNPDPTSDGPALTLELGSSDSDVEMTLCYEQSEVELERAPNKEVEHTHGGTPKEADHAQGAGNADPGSSGVEADARDVADPLQQMETASHADSLEDLPVPEDLGVGETPNVEGEPETPVPLPALSCTGPGKLWYGEPPQGSGSLFSLATTNLKPQPSMAPLVNAPTPPQEALAEAADRRLCASPTPNQSPFPAKVAVTDADGCVRAKEENDEIPALGDEFAVQPELGAPQLSKAAIAQRARRMFAPRANGKLKVSQKIFDEWHSKGKERRTLEEIFKRCGYDPDWGSRHVVPILL